jgi:Immunoglobulin-like domain of bacterial spore germination/Sporulation and spore germination
MDDDLTTLLHDAVAEVEPTDRLAEIRREVSSRPRRKGWYVAGGAALAVAATVTAIALVTSPTAPKADHPGPVAAPDTHLVAVYYLGPTPRGERLYREFHDVTGADSLDVALAELSVQPDDPDYQTFWQPGQLLGATVSGGVIRVEVDPTLAVGQEGRPYTDLMLGQVIYTLQGEFGGRIPVQFVHDGQPIAELLGQPTSEPLSQDDPLDVLALVSISDPVEGLVVVGDGFIASGAASSFEGNVPWRLTDADGTVVRKGFATAGMDDHLVPWETEPIDVSDLEPGTYVFTASTEGGQPFTDTRTVVVR